MRILIDDGMQVEIGTGIGKYTQYLYEILLKSANSSMKVEITSFKRKSGKKLLDRLRYLLYINSNNYLSISERFDVIHFTNYMMPFRRKNNVKYVVTVHDLVSYIYPETLPTLYRIYNQWIIKYSLKNADAVITDSMSVKEEIGKFFPKYISKVSVCYPGFSEEYSANNIECVGYSHPMLNMHITKGNFFLFVGTIEKRKNISMIIEAYFKFREINQDANMKLVLAGRSGLGFSEFIKVVNTSKWKDDVIFTGYISSEDCKMMYQSALAYIFPTVYEGFGSTQLECMANGLPIILSDIPTNREISEGYGLFFDLADVQSLVNQMTRVYEHDIPYDDMNTTAKTRLNKFRWNVLVKDYVDIYKGLIKK